MIQSGNSDQTKSILIPAFNHSHVLPPFLGANSTDSAQISPYKTTFSEFANRLATSPERAQLLLGMLEYRKAIRGLGFTSGFQWVDGSFAENVEQSQGRAPKDIDLVTFAHPPTGLDKQEINRLMDANPDIFNRSQAKDKFGCDTFIVPLGQSPEILVRRATYYFQLFSHRRDDQVWKGFLQIPLEADRAETEQMLRNSFRGEQNASPT